MIYYTVNKFLKEIEVEELIPHEVDIDSLPADFYNYRYKYKDFKMIRLPLETESFMDKCARETAETKQNYVGKKSWSTNMGDRLWGERGREVDGIVNPANGKRYDSKSKYYKDLKANGLHVMEGDIKQPSTVQGDFNVRKELTEATRQVLSKQ